MLKFSCCSCLLVHFYSGYTIGFFFFPFSFSFLQSQTDPGQGTTIFQLSKICGPKDPIYEKFGSNKGLKIDPILFICFFVCLLL